MTVVGLDTISISHVHVIVVVPRGKVSPEFNFPDSIWIKHSIVTGVKKSVALGGSNVTTALPSALVTSTV